jgi:hypothetical protein
VCEALGRLRVEGGNEVNWEIERKVKDTMDGDDGREWDDTRPSMGGN